jgi:general secretion pathway protein D
MRFPTLSTTLRASVAVLLICLSPLLEAQEQTWKINLKNADINEFVAQVAAITGKTFVVDPRVKGKVTVISNASLDVDGIYELFLSVLRVHGFAAIETSGVIRIQQQTLAKQSSSPLDEAPRIAGEQLVTRVIAAQYVDSAELVKTLRPMIPQYGHIAAVTNPNVVIISDHAENIVRLQRIIARIDVPDEEQVVVVPLRDAWVGNVVELLQKLAPEQIGANAKGPQRIQIIANERNNSLVLRGKSGPVSQVKKLIDQIDQPATATGATQVIRLNHGDAKAVAEIVKGLVTPEGAGKEGAAAQTVNVQADESLNAIVVRADPTVMGEIAEIVRKLDVRRTQVLIEAAIVEISIDDSLDLGVDTAGIDQDGDSVPLFSTALSPALGAIVEALTPTDGSDIPTAALSAVTNPFLAVAKLDPNGFSFAAILQAISTSSRANLLSTPSILTLDNEEAKILVGQEVPFRTGTYTTTTDGANNPFTTIQRQDVGVTLTVTPHIHEGESVRLEVSQEVSQVVLSALAVSAANPFSDVVTNKRTIDTTVLADDGQTIVLGGLIQDDVQSTKKKVPLLGDIPLLGRLFQNTEDQRIKRNLLVFLRPTVLRTREDVGAATERKYESVWDVDILEDMPYRDAPSGTTPTQPPVDSLYDGHRE